MKRLGLTLLAGLLAVLPAQGHFLFLVPEPDGQSALLIFSDSLEPDRPELLAKVRGTQVRFRSGTGPAVDLKGTDNKNAFRLAAPEGKPGLVAASLKYGVVAKGDTPFLLHYYASTWLAGAAKAPLAAVQAEDQLALQIMPLGGRKFQVRWQGKPLADAVVAIVGGDQAQEVKADILGTFELPRDAPALVGLRVRQVEARAGELDGKAYKEVRHYATLVVRL